MPRAGKLIKGGKYSREDTIDWEKVLTGDTIQGVHYLREDIN